MYVQRLLKSTARKKLLPVLFRQLVGYCETIQSFSTVISVRTKTFEVNGVKMTSVLSHKNGKTSYVSTICVQFIEKYF